MSNAKGQRTNWFTIWSGGSNEPWSLDDLPMMESWLDNNDPVLDLVGKAVRQPAFCFPMIRRDSETPLSDALMSMETQRMRIFARSLMARANYRIATGDFDGAIDDVITIKRLGRHLQRQGGVLEFVVGIAIESMADAIGVAGNGELQPTKGQLRRLVDELQTCPPPADMGRVWLAERYAVLDALQSVALGRRSFDELLTFFQLGKNDRPDFTPGLSVDWNVVMRRMNVAFDNPTKGRKGPPPQQEALNAASRGERSRRVAEYLARKSLPANSGIQEGGRRTESSDNLRRISLAMLLYEREYGTLPPACTLDPNGAPLHSWRVLLLPFLGKQSCLPGSASKNPGTAYTIASFTAWPQPSINAPVLRLVRARRPIRWLSASILLFNRVPARFSTISGCI